MEDLYDGFDVNYNINNDEDTNNTSIVGTSYNMNDSIRPMTSNKSAGYSSQKKSSLYNKNLFKSQKNEEIWNKDNDNDDDNKCLKVEEMEKTVNKLLRESIFYSSCGDYESALNLAQKCRKKEREVIEFREKHNLDENINTDLTFSVLFNLGYIYELKRMYLESLNIYNIIINNNNNRIEIICRIRVNIGNIYYKQKKYDLAIKHYRMSLDQIGDINYKLKINILRNIGNSFIKLGQFVDAIQSFENIVDLHSNHSSYCDIQSIFNLIISYYTLGDKEKMKKGFILLLNCSLLIPHNNNDNNNNNNNKKNDEYSIYIKRKWLELSNYIKQTVQLIGKAIANNNDEYSGYDWIIDHLYELKQKQQTTTTNKQILNKIILQVIISKGIEYLKDNKFKDAIKIFSELREDKEDDKEDNVHHNNLSFINFLKCEYEQSSKYAISALNMDRYNALSLVNRANCLCIFGEYESAKEMYLEAIGVEADCIEAIYNLGLICKKMGNYNDALQAFKKLNKIDCDGIGSSRDPQILYEISNLYELLNEYEIAIKWYKILHSVIPSDSTILIKLANLYKLYLKDETLIYHNYLDSYKLYKCNINIISWLGIYYINNELYENAINIFKNAYQIQPKQIKWKLMIASCYRRMRNFKKSINIYMQILNHDDNDNDNDNDITIKCLQYLCTIMKQINHPQLNKYEIKLNQQLQIQQQIEQQIEQQNHHQINNNNNNNNHNNHNMEETHQHHNHNHNHNDDDDDDDNDDDNNWADVHIDDELLPS